MAKKVLVADDSTTIRQAFDLTFAGDSGVEVLGAGDASSALSTARDQGPDLVIVDAGLGDSSGYDLCKQLKADPSTSALPVWIMTGPAERLDDDLYAGCGADGHLRKPWDTQRLIDKVGAMASPPEEERARPSYPPSTAGRFPVGKPQVPSPKPAAPPQSAPHAQGRREGKATLMGGPVPPAKPPQEQRPAPAQPAPEKPATPGPAAPQKPAPEPSPPQKPATPVPAAPQKPAPAPAAPLDESVAASVQASAALEGLGDEQRQAVMALIREAVEKTVWEIVPDMAEIIIREEITRLLKD